jgi:hypothetical protein
MIWPILAALAALLSFFGLLYQKHKDINDIWTMNIWANAIWFIPYLLLAIGKK